MMSKEMFVALKKQAYEAEKKLIKYFSIEIALSSQSSKYQFICCGRSKFYKVHA